MANTGLKQFDATVRKSNEILKIIEEGMGWENERHKSYGILRAVLMVLRDRLTVNEASDLGAQLTPLLRGLFYEQWQPAKMPFKMNKEEFFKKILETCGFAPDKDIEELIAFVLKVIMSHISPGEVEEIKTILPTDIRELLE